MPLETAELVGIDRVNFNIGATVQLHANVPPFFLQIVVRSSTASSKERVCSTS